MGGHRIRSIVKPWLYSQQKNFWYFDGFDILMDFFFFLFKHFQFHLADPLTEVFYAVGGGRNERCCQSSRQREFEE